MPEASQFDWKQKWKHLVGVREERALQHDKGWEQQCMLIEQGEKELAGFAPSASGSGGFCSFH